MAVSFVPVIGDLKDFQEVVTGRDLITGETLSTTERAITVAAAVLPIVGGAALRKTLGAVDEAVGVADDIVPGGVLGDLTNAEVQQIQGVVNSAGRPLEVVGSAAKGTRRGVGTDFPIGKGSGTRSDIDFLVPPSSRQHFAGLEDRLPSLDPASGIIPGVHNPHIGPAVRFEPEITPFFIPEAKQ